METQSTQLSPERLSTFLKTRLLGRLLEYHACIDSTNIRAKQLASFPEREGLVVIADSQTAGRGRMTRVWQSPPGRNLYFSIIIRPDVPPQTLPQLALLCAIAAHKAMSKTIPDHHFGLKWPNDLWSEQQKKLSGILCEGVMNGAQTSVVAGIGINVNGQSDDFPPEIRNTAGTLEEIAGHPLDRTEFLAHFLNSLEPILDEWQRAQSLLPFIDYWNKFDCLQGKNITVQDSGDFKKGIAKGIMHDGRLILTTQDGELFIHAGDVHILKNG
ncbi:MAG: biotin--[acetyl-CoA-carboxylase] ligase [Victivallales bacterium]|nr:biotin--[acetyl-CoA-carboxylase] ligase [Victivallales bacterium]